MIPAEQHPAASPLVERYILASLRGHFSSLRLRVESPDTTPTATLFHATHVSWWDGYLALAVARSQGLSVRVMMLERELRRYGFLRYAGAFGFDPGRPADVRAALAYAARQLLEAGPVAVTLFPAGEIVPADRRPLAYRPGAAMLLRLSAPAPARALAWRLEHLGAQHPVAVARLGPPRRAVPGQDRRALERLLCADLEREADAVAADLRDGRLGEYATILPGRASVAERWDAARRLAGRRTA